MGNLLQKVENYWDGRSEGYSEVNLSELKSHKMKAWKDLINAHKPNVVGRKLKVLDIGTGPGFFAITMASCGYNVTGIDYTAAMLHQAKKNAGEYRKSIKFIQMDAHYLAFEDNSFDLIVSRNLTWNLENPQQAYKEWQRVLRPEGVLLNFDANWYLHLHDDEKRLDYEKDRLNSQKEGVNDHYVETDSVEMEEIAKNLPLSKTMRPQWDAVILLNLGFKKIKIEQNMGSLVWNKEEQINYCSTPMFMICGKK